MIYRILCYVTYKNCDTAARIAAPYGPFLGRSPVLIMIMFLGYDTGYT